MSPFASNIGSEHLIGLSGSGVAAVIGVGAFELNVSLVCLFLYFKQILLTLTYVVPVCIFLYLEFLSLIWHLIFRL